ncbi:replication-associated recombination protein A [Natronoglycomyces albus]|uniref:Replication-associated recombination protein A n=1 Tax=Natronoglycomyces albus TaxID=2811108 RepID=A0A895XQP7_9ACTN|nr:replication-associated recombination protein A [Natronoglycomyces albus]QSB03888.1 replication-associated recombination protein A [Natronoglycomyces albus]
MDTPGLFDSHDDDTAASAIPTDAPLAVRMRPSNLEELVGQQHLLASGAPLRQLVHGGQPMSVILWGPPGSGKTTIAHLVAGAIDRRFRSLSALDSGVKQVRAEIDHARQIRRTGGAQTVLFIDEVHRFNKTQQDSLLSAVEDRTITLLAATTENPYFSVVSPLVSRCIILTLHDLTDEDLGVLIDRALTDQRGLSQAVSVTEEAREHLVRLAAGDARKSLTALEAAAASVLSRGETVIDVESVSKAIDMAAARYDRSGDGHYDIASAFIKSLRGSDVDAALHWLARMIVAGEDPRFIARRLVIFASEDVGMADPTLLQTTTAAAAAVERIGLPEARLALGQAVIHAATAPKSNAVIVAVDEAMSDVRKGLVGPVPAGIRDAHYQGAKKLGHGSGYRYPHNYPRGIVAQDYAPEPVAGRDYYRPTTYGGEADLSDRVNKLRRIVRSGSGGAESGGDAR